MTLAYDPPREGARILDRYVLVGPRDDRGLGQTWRAHDSLSDSAERLIKFHPLAASDAHDVDAHVARHRGVSAPGVATVLAGGAWQGRLFLVHDACAGRSLQHWFDGWRTTQTQPTPATSRLLFLHLCSVLHEAHGKGIAHERLNPRSVVITSVTAPRPLVLFDAGVSAFLSGDDLATCANYLAPEALDRPRKGAAIDLRRADLFALGVILAELLTLRSTPRSGTRETWEQLARANPKKPMASLVARPDDVPADLWSLVERLLFDRGDLELATPSKIRQAARKAWEAAGARDDAPEALREAPQPIAQPPQAARPSARIADAEDARRTTTPPREPSPTHSTSQPPSPARAVVVQAYSVEPPSRAPAPAQTPVESPPAADTLIDTGDARSEALAVVQAIRAGKSAPPVTSAAGATLLVSDLPGPYAASIAHDRAGVASSTLVVNPRHTNVNAAAPKVDEAASSDPFASYGKRDSGTLAVEDSFAQPGGPMPASARPNETLAMDPRSFQGFAHGSPPGAPLANTGHTLPIESGTPFAPMRPSAAPAPSSALGARFVVVVIVAGVAIGVLVVALLRVG